MTAHESNKRTAGVPDICQTVFCQNDAHDWPKSAIEFRENANQWVRQSLLLPAGSHAEKTINGRT